MQHLKSNRTYQNNNPIDEVLKIFSLGIKSTEYVTDPPWLTLHGEESHPVIRSPVGAGNPPGPVVFN